VIQEDGVDVVCRGEGEYPMLELCDRLEAGCDFADLSNLWVKQHGRIYRNSPRPLIQDLDSLPFPDREPRYALDEHHRQYATQSFLTSRGCPYRCAYCFNVAMGRLYGPPWFCRRVRSPENVVREIEAVRAVSGLSFVQFRCSMFPHERQWLEEFAAIYPRRVGLPFYAHVRANHMSEEVVSLLAQAGCKSVNMGIECADETYRREVLHRPMSNQTIRDACRRLHDHGIAILADNMVGLPGRTLEDDIETLRFNAECQIEYPLAMILQPYPGTEIDRYAREHGHFDGDYSAIGYNYYFRSPLRFASEAERQQIENLQKLFAVTAEAPWLLPIVRRLIRLRPNLVFTSIFRWWYAWCYLRRIMRHRLRWADVLETLRVLFGIYPKEAFDADLEENDEEARAVVRGVPGGDDVGGCGPVLDGLPQEGEVSLAAASP
jgi:hypothetical protein